METLQAIKSKHAVRQFSDQPVPEATAQAPSPPQALDSDYLFVSRRKRATVPETGQLRTNLR